MSAEAMSYVFKHSPYQGTSAQHAVVLAIADTVSDVNGNRFYMSKAELAKKARLSQRWVGKAIDALTDDGWLEKVRDATFTDPAEYEFLMPGDRDVQWEPRRVREQREARERAASAPDAPSAPDTPSPPDGASGPDVPSSPDGASTPDVSSGPDAASGGNVASPPDGASRGGVTPRPGRGDAASGEGGRSVTRTQENPIQPNVEPKPSTSSPAGDDPDPPTTDLEPAAPDVPDDARRLCGLFEELVRRNGHVTPKPNTQGAYQWLREMERLLRLGPPGGDGDPDLVPDPDTVETVIRWCAADSFEAANVLSVPKFRKRFSQLRAKALAGPTGGRRRDAGQAADTYAAAAEELRRQGR